MSRTRDLQLGFADLEFLRQGVVLERELQTITDCLDEAEEMVEAVGADLRRGLKNANTGRKGLTPQQVLRSLILMRVKNWDYRGLRERIADGLRLRRFTDFRPQPVSKHDAFQRAFKRVTPQTLRLVNELLIRAAVAMGLEDGRKLRVDTTVVQTDIHHPTDNTLLWDVVRVLTRLVDRLEWAIWLPMQGFRNRIRAARRRMQALHRVPPSATKRHQRKKYRELIDITEEVVECARHGLRDTHKICLIDPVAQSAVQELHRQIEHYCSLGERVIDQTRRRVLQGEQVSNTEKIYSIFEPHTDLIKRGKVLTPVEFGHKVFLAESAQGLITQYDVLNGNPSDSDHVEASLSRHQATFGSVPQLYGSDRGFFTEENLAACQQRGVEMACIPQRGGTKSAEREAYEKSPAFKKAQRFRAGIEGRISVLFRGRGMQCGRAEGRERFELLVGAAVLANNLLKIAELLGHKHKPRRPAA